MKKIKFGDFGDLKGAEIIDTVIGGGGNFRLSAYCQNLQRLQMDSGTTNRNLSLRLF